MEVVNLLSVVEFQIQDVIKLVDYFLKKVIENEYNILKVS